MINAVSKVYKGSLAEEVGIEVGDKLLTINGTEVKDLIDYRFLMADEYIVLEVEKADNEIWEIEIEKEYDEKLGVEFENAIMDKAQSCHNKCIFCFIDQLPKGMRETLYFKDDDSRLAFLQGNFITLTNMKDEDIDRIIKYKISPINVSVHTTNPELRKMMTNNRFAGNIYERLQKMAKAGITINCQVVLCPGINDGDEIERTIRDLYNLYPQVSNVAIVPVGITKYREGLYNLKLFNKQSALNTINQIESFQKKCISEIGEPFVRLSDEFYLTAGTDVPKSECYGNYEQLEDGVGMIRYYRDIIKSSLPQLKDNVKGSFTIATGVSAFNEIKNSAELIMSKNSFINIDVVKIINNFFGETITVAGLITGKDLIEQLKDKNLGKYIIIPNNMLRKGYEPGDINERVFLDDVTVEQLEEELNRKVLVVDYTGDDFIHIINEFCEEE